MNKIIINEFPFPISINESLIPKFGRLIKSNKSRKYDVTFNEWETKNRVFLNEAKNIIKQWINDKKVLSVTTILGWPKKDILVNSKNKKAKNFVQKKDGSNRIKQLHDKLSLALDIDDCYFFIEPTFKTYHDKEIPLCTVIIQPADIMSYDEIIKIYHQQFESIDINKAIERSEKYEIYKPKN